MPDDNKESKGNTREEFILQGVEEKIMKSELEGGDPLIEAARAHQKNIQSKPNEIAEALRIDRNSLKTELEEINQWISDVNKQNPKDELGQLGELKPNLLSQSTKSNDSNGIITR